MKLQSITGDMAWAIVSYNAVIKNSFKSVKGILYELRAEPERLLIKEVKETMEQRSKSTKSISSLHLKR